MQRTILIIALGMQYGLAQLTYADSTVQLNNYTALMPVYYQEIGKLAYGNDFYIEVLGGAAGESGPGLFPITPVGASSPIIRLKEPGFFDAGIGIISGVRDYADANLAVRGWYGSPTFEEAALLANAGETITWSQITGFWDPNSGLLPTGPALEMISPLKIGVPIPEPTTLALAIVGGVLFLGGTLKKKRYLAEDGAKK
jgi:hypothetical protein